MKTKARYTEMQLNSISLLLTVCVFGIFGLGIISVVEEIINISVYLGILFIYGTGILLTGLIVARAYVVGVLKAPERHLDDFGEALQPLGLLTSCFWASGVCAVSGYVYLEHREGHMIPIMVLATASIVSICVVVLQMIIRLLDSQQKWKEVLKNEY